MTDQALLVGRFMRLARRSDERWQGGLVRLPMWVDGPAGPVRPWGAVWASRRTGLAHVKAGEGDTPEWMLALTSLVEFGLQARLAGCRPAAIEVADEELGRRIQEALGDPELEVARVDALAAVKDVVVAMEAHEADGRPIPGLLVGRGATTERVRSFAAAARQFWEATPWERLTDEDLIHVEAPVPSPGLARLAVLGAALHTFGIGFFHSVEDFEAVQEGPSSALQNEPRWSVLFGPMNDLPFGDADLWDEHDLPVAEPDAYPLAVQFHPDGPRRPDARTLAYLEGLLRVLAESTEDEIDTGRWERTCETADGAVRYRLAIPALLEPPEAPPSTATTPLDQAEDLAFQAGDAHGRRRSQLARKALALSRDCTDAWLILAEEAIDPERACELQAEAVAAAERGLGPTVFEREAGHFWGLLKTRPYMRARLALAESLRVLGRRGEAITHYLELLRLNPSDNQGVRESALVALLLERRDGEAAALLERYPDDPFAGWLYGRALLAYRRDGDSPTARATLGVALGANRRVARYLKGATPLPEEIPDSYAYGSQEEAVIAADLLKEAWRDTPGAVAWLGTGDRIAPGGGKKKRRR